MSLDFNGLVGGPYLQRAGSVIGDIPPIPFSVAGWAFTRAGSPPAFKGTAFSISSTLVDQEYYQMSVRPAGTLAWTAREAPFGPVMAETLVPVPLGTWSHFCGIEVALAPALLRREVYLDGGNRVGNGGSAAVDFTGRAPATNFALLDRPTPVGEWDGLLAHWAIWNGQLSAQEVLSLASGAYPLAVRGNDLIAYWPLNGTATGTEPDVIADFDVLPINGAAPIREEPLLIRPRIVAP